MPLLEEVGDDAGLAQAWQAVGETEWNALHFAAVVDALERSTVHARRAGDEAQIEDNELTIPVARVTGRLPAGEMARIAADMRAAGNLTPTHEHARLMLAAVAAAFLGRFDEARDLVSRGRAIGEALGALTTQGYPLEASRNIEILAGDAEAAERFARRAYEIGARAGALGYSCTSAAWLALSLYDLGRHDEAYEFMQISRSTGGSDDVMNEALWRRAAAKLCAQRGEGDDAVRLAGEAVALMEPTDALDDHADTLVDLAEVLRLLGRAADGVEPLRRALALYEQKENVVSASRVRERIAGLARASRSDDRMSDHSGGRV